MRGEILSQEETISGKDAAKMLKVSYSHLYALIDRGILQRVENANTLRKHAPLRFRRADVERLAQETEEEDFRRLQPAS